MKAPLHPAAPRASQRPNSGAQRRSSPLTDDQYLASSLALVARLSRQVRGTVARHG